MPTEFTHTIIGSNAVELAWTQPNELIDGFTVIKRKNGIEKAVELDKISRTYEDNVVLDSAEMSICTTVSYSLFATAGVQKSSAASLPGELLFPQPTPSNAGADITATALTVNLTANLPGSSQNGKWTIISGEGGVIEDINAPNSLFTGKINHTYILEWEISSCNTVSTDQVTIIFPIAVAGNGVTDIDGNNYPTQVIGEQEWMSENLNTTRYRNGESIPNVTGQSEWAASASGAWCFYENNFENGEEYGKLYNWHAVADPRGLCPAGWHVPSDAEWSVLIDYLGGESVAGGKMKSVTGWNSPNVAATNESGFSGLPGGSRNDDGGDLGVGGDNGFWWGSLESSATDAWARYLYWNNGDMGRFFFNKRGGFSVRCLRD